MDKFSKEVRSDIMRAVRSHGNISTELKLIDFFREKKIKGWHRNYRLFGKPDFVFPAKRVAVFVDGCFWHGHNCRKVKPKSNIQYWKKKIKRNKIRDKDVSKVLREKNWQVYRIYECQIRKPKIQTALLRTLSTES